MSAKTTMRYFEEINTFFEATGFAKRTNLPHFFIFKFEELNDQSAVKMPPYQTAFFQIALVMKSTQSEIAINQQTSNALGHTLFALSPEHIFSWQRDASLTGFVLYFKPAFFDFFNGRIHHEFPFFNVSDRNILPLNAEQSAVLAADFAVLYHDYYTDNLYREQILQSFFLSLLFKCKGFFQTADSAPQKTSKKHELLNKFRNLVQNLYIQHKSVGDYAAKLFVTPNHLNDTVKELTGKTAKTMIAETLVEMAQKRLKYSTDDIAEIAFYLGFDEPTHFIRFFKNQVGCTPKTFRDNP